MQTPREQRRTGGCTSGMNFGSSMHAMFHAVRSIDLAHSSSSTKLTSRNLSPKPQSESLKAAKGTIVSEAEPRSPQCLSLRNSLRHTVLRKTVPTKWQAKEVLMCKCGSYTWKSDDGTLSVCKLCKKRPDITSVQGHEILYSCHLSSGSVSHPDPTFAETCFAYM